MKKLLLVFCFLLPALFYNLNAQTIYVDQQKGHDDASGSITAPLQTLKKAVVMAAGFSGYEAVNIKLGPGIYELSDRLDLKTKATGNNVAKYTLEAAIMPDDSIWWPWLMPVIESFSANNNNKNFEHCSGILADRANVCIRGLRFLGNGNPGVFYYYPVEKDTATLNNIEISQCYFIGDRYGSVIQGAAYIQGRGIHIDHSIFYNCKNAVLAFQNLRDFSFSHSIIYGAYECGIWYGDIDANSIEMPFVFSNNIITKCRYFWAESQSHDHSYYKFDNSVICDNQNYVGVQDGRGGVMSLSSPEYYQEAGIRKTGIIKLEEAKIGIDVYPKRFLNLSVGSDGYELEAGIFKTHK